MAVQGYGRRPCVVQCKRRHNVAECRGASDRKKKKEKENYCTIVCRVERWQSSWYVRDSARSQIAALCAGLTVKTDGNKIAALKLLLRLGYCSQLDRQY
jgi:hypothetical protein